MDSIFLQDETSGTKSQTKKKPSNKESDTWKGKDFSTKIKLIAGSVVGEFQDIYSSVVDSEGKSSHRLAVFVIRVIDVSPTYRC
jgi:hypothetical protein